MSNVFKRRVCRLCLWGVTCLLSGLFLSELVDTGVKNMLLDVAGFVFLLAGIVILFRAFETFSFWNEDTSEDQNDHQPARNLYPNAFFIAAVLATLLTMSLLGVILIRNQLNSQEFIISAFSLMVAGACMILSRLSTGIQTEP